MSAMLLGKATEDVRRMSRVKLSDIGRQTLVSGESVCGSNSGHVVASKGDTGQQAPSSVATVNEQIQMNVIASTPRHK
jgi:hypothetical protein